MFYKTVKRTRKDMIEYLDKHFRYYLANSWNLLKTFANCVKIPNLNLTAEQASKAYDFLCAECDDYENAINIAFDEFKMKTGCTVGFNGRSGGYLIINGGLSQSDINGYHDYDKNQLSSIVDIITAFDKLCDDVRDIFIYYIDNCKIKEEIYTVKKTRVVAIIENQSD